MPAQDITYRFNSAGIDRFFDDLAAVAGALAGRPGLKSGGEMLRERAGALGRYLAENTMPLIDAEASAPTVAADGTITVGSPTAISDSTAQVDGRSKSARQIGINAVVRDIRRVYSPPSATYKALKARGQNDAAKAFYQFIKRGKTAEARALLQRLGLDAKSLEVLPWDGGGRHQAARASRGRVSASHKPVIIDDEKQLKAYMKEIAARVGWAKSAWIAAARQIPGAKGFSGISRWMSLPAPGVGIDGSKNSTNPFIRLESRVSYSEDALNQRTFRRAQAAFEESLVKEFEIVLAKLAKKYPQLGLAGLQSVASL